VLDFRADVIGAISCRVRDFQWLETEEILAQEPRA
jgi:hypothetical protein